MLIARRNFLASAAAAVPLVAAPERRLKICVTGGHPGDPECGCAGTIARYTALGHDVAIVYLNRGEGYCGDAGPDCGRVRTAEAKKACEILKARPVFAGQIDSKAVVDNAHYDDFYKLIEAEKPDILFTQWPIDHHRDHRAVSMLALDAWERGGRKAAFYYYEVADDTAMFTPAEYVDITPAEAQRRAACYAHASQSPGKWYPHQVELTRFRGQSSGFTQAEGFVRHWLSKPALLP